MTLYRVSFIDTRHGLSWVGVEAVDGSGNGGFVIEENLVELPKPDDLIRAENLGEEGARISWNGKTIVWRDGTWATEETV